MNGFDNYYSFYKLLTVIKIVIQTIMKNKHNNYEARTYDRLKMLMFANTKH